MIPRRSMLSALGAGLAVASLAQRSRAGNGDSAVARESIAVLGTGHLGGALGKRLAALGHSVTYGSRTPDQDAVKQLARASGPHASVATLADAAARAGIVLFALPWEPVKALLPTLGDLGGKLLIDPMNAAPKTVDGYPFRADSMSTSVAEQLQSLVPGVQVVKAFNAISASDLAKPPRRDAPISIPLAGSDKDAVARVARLVSELGLDPVDFGPLVVARYIEDLLWFEVACVRHNKKLFELYLRPMPA